MEDNVNFIQTLVSSVWPNWKITKKLGNGTYGSVYEIVREDIGNRYSCAMKVLRMESVDTDTTGSELSVFYRSFL